MQLSHQPYAEFNDTHFAGRLVEEEVLKLSREMVRKKRRMAGMGPERKRRPAWYCQYLEQKELEGGGIKIVSTRLPLPRRPESYPNNKWINWYEVEGQNDACRSKSRGEKTELFTDPFTSAMERGHTFC